MVKKIDCYECIDELLLAGKQIVLYGAGNYGITTKKYLKKFYDTDISGFAVSDDISIIDSYIDGIEVKHLFEFNKDILLVVCVSEQHQEQLLKNANAAGFTNIYILLNEFHRYMCSELDENRLLPLEKLNFEIHITEHCNLNCKGCYHFSPLSKPDFLSVEEFESDMKQMALICRDKVASITLLGGEPLLHPKIVHFFKVTRENFPDCRVQLLTNGTLLKNMNLIFWQSCLNYDITLCCTKYPVIVDWESVERKAAEFGLCIDYHNDVGAGEKTLIKYPFDITGTQDPQWNYKHCTRSNKCITLKHGKIYTCPMAAHAHLAKDYFDIPLELSELDGIDIYTVNTFEEISNFLIRPIPFCRYCNLKIKPEQIEWQVSKKELSEWF